MSRHTSNRTRSAAVAAALSVAAAGNLPPARAQTQGSAMIIEEITVTARKREERLLDVPVAMTVVSAERIEAQSMARLEDVTYAVPNLSIAGGGTDAAGTGFGVVFIRGIGQVDYANSIDPGVGTYVDGVYLGRAVGGNLDLPDVERIEVLRGPQGTLFGKNTMGGAINVTTKRPSFTNRGSLSVTYGEDSRADVEGEADLRLSPTVAARVVGAYRSQDGFIDRYYGGDAVGEEETAIGRVKLEFRPSDTLNVLLSADYTDATGTLGKVSLISDPAVVGDFLGILWNDVPPALVADFFDNGVPDGSSPPIPGLPDVPYSVLEGERISPANDFNTMRRTGAAGERINDYEAWGSSLRIEKEFDGGATLRSISAYRTLESSVGGDEDGQRANISFAVWNDEQEQFSQEFNLFGTSASGRLDWLVGAYYFDESADAFQTIHQNLPWFMADILFGTDVQSYAAFAEGTWRFTERWSAVVGARYTSEDKDFYAVQVCSPMMLLQPICPGGFLIPHTTTSESWSSVDPRVGLQFRPNGDWLLYGQFSTGFKSGGFNARPSSPAEVEQPFDMEELEAFEIGAKGTLAGGGVIVTLAAFTYEYDALQMVISGISPQTGTAVAAVGNLGDASLWGVEGEVTLRPVEGLLLTAALGYTSAEYDSLDPSVLGLITSVGSPAVTLDHELPRTPELTGNVGVEYSMPVGASNTLTWRADYAYVDDQFSDVQNFRETMTPSHENLNARITYAYGDRWQLALYGKNLTDETYVANGFWTQGGQGSVAFLVPNEPREVGLTLRVSF